MLLADGPDVSFSGTFHRSFGILPHDQVPSHAIQTVEVQWCHRIHDVLHFVRIERNHVGIAIHKTDVAPVLGDLHRVARQERAPSLRALCPVQYIRAGEVSPTTDQGQATQDMTGFALPEYKGGIGAHDPLAIVDVPVNGRVIEGLTSIRPASRPYAGATRQWRGCRRVL